MHEGPAPAPNRALAQRVYELFNRRDLDALLEVTAPDIEWDWSRSIGPGGGDVYRGVEAVTGFLHENWEHWSLIEMTPEEIMEAGEELVVSVHVRARGRDGIEVEARGSHVQTWRDGRLVRYRLFQEREDALTAVGL